MNHSYWGYPDQPEPWNGLKVNSSLGLPCVTESAVALFSSTDYCNTFENTTIKNISSDIDSQVSHANMSSYDCNLAEPDPLKNQYPLDNQYLLDNQYPPNNQYPLDNQYSLDNPYDDFYQMPVVPHPDNNPSTPTSSIFFSKPYACHHKNAAGRICGADFSYIRFLKRHVQEKHTKKP